MTDPTDLTHDPKISGLLLTLFVGTGTTVLGGLVWLALRMRGLA